jgi:hypothetical protein
MGPDHPAPDRVPLLAPTASDAMSRGEDRIEAPFP